MQKSDFQGFLNRQIKITLSSGYVYSGQIISLFEDSLLFSDRFDNRLLVKYSAIASVLNYVGRPRPEGKSK